MFILAKEHGGLVDCVGWWYRPTGLFAHANRISNSAILPNTSIMRDATANMFGRGGVRRANGHLNYLYEDEGYPNMFSTPFVSNVHVDPASNAIPPWAMPRWGPGSILMSYIGSLGKLNHGDVMVCAKLQQQCIGYRNRSICQMEAYQGSLISKLRATFCLEPAGDGDPTRPDPTRPDPRPDPTRPDPTRPDAMRHETTRPVLA